MQILLLANHDSSWNGIRGADKQTGTTHLLDKVTVLQQNMNEIPNVTAWAEFMGFSRSAE